MAYPLRTPQEELSRQEALMEQSILAARPDVSPTAVARAVRSPRGMLAAICRVNAMALYGLHLHLAWWGRQYFPDTAEADQLDRHGDIWGVYRRAATTAIGSVVFSGEAGAELALGLELRSVLGVFYRTTEAGLLPVEGTLSVAVEAVDAGVDGNADGGTVLALSEPVDGLAAQQAVVDQEGLAGGAARESDADLVARILDRIRAPAHGGASDDYRLWVQGAFAASHVQANPFPGGVTVVVAMGTRSAPRVPTSTEITAIATYLDGVRPIGMAEFFVVPVSLTPVDHVVVVNPDDSRVRNNVAAALAAFYAREAEIGGVVRRSRISEAISAAAGEYSHELIAPAADIVCADTELAVLGDISWDQA